MLLDGTSVNAPVILGYSPPSTQDKKLSDIVTFNSATKYALRADETLTKSIRKVQRKVQDYCMQGLAGYVETLESNQAAFNDLEMLDPTYRPTEFSVWTHDKVVRGIQLNYANGEKSSYGDCPGQVPHSSIKLAENGSEIICELQVYTAQGAGKTTSVAAAKVDQTVISRIRVVTSLCQELDSDVPTGPAQQASASPKPKDPEAAEEVEEKATTFPKASTDDLVYNTATDKTAVTTFVRPDEHAWSLRGFFGFKNGKGKNDRPTSLGVVWGKDRFVPRPESNVSLPLSRTFFNFDQKSMDLMKSIRSSNPHFHSYFLMGQYLGGVKKDTAFNDLEHLKPEKKIKTLAFYTKAGKLAGIKTTWDSGDPKVYGTFPTTVSIDVWTIDVGTDLLSARITQDNDHIQTVEFIRAGPDGKLPAWLLDLSTLRYLGDPSQQASLKKDKFIVEVAPAIDNAKWTVRGFYGTFSVEENNQVISGLGVIWGRG